MGEKRLLVGIFLLFGKKKVYFGYKYTKMNDRAKCNIHFGSIVFFFSFKAKM